MPTSWLDAHPRRKPSVSWSEMSHAARALADRDRRRAPPPV